MTNFISGTRILVVEDDYHLASELRAELSSIGAQIAGPVPSVREALNQMRMDDEIAGAVLDINLGQENVFPVADELDRRAIPFIFTTGYELDIIPARHANRIVLRKPLEHDAVASALRRTSGGNVRIEEASRNSILNRLSASDLDQVLPLLRKMHLPRGAILERPGQTVSRVYFPLECVAALLAVGVEGTRLEAGLIGREGLTGLGLAVDDDETPYELVNQIEGSALVMAAEDFCRLATSLPSLRTLTLRFSRALALQVSFTAMANGRFELRQRLARWLLMIQDRTHENPFRVTHDEIAAMLGVRRPSVTDTLHILEGEKLIRANRRQIEILSRRGLMATAGEIYGSSEREYARLIRLTLPDPR